MLRRLLDNESRRIAWVARALGALPPGRLLDAGCGSQQYRKYCGHLRYEAQDFGQVSLDDQDSFAARSTPYEYGPLDYTGDIWAIAAPAAHFDHVLCTEVFEHIPYPVETLREFARLLKPGGTLILTLPCNCLRHMDPHWYSSGYSDRWLRRVLPETGFSVRELVAVGDYHSWMSTEMARSMRRAPWAAPFLLPAFAYFLLRRAFPSPQSQASLCEGYYVIATREGTAA